MTNLSDRAAARKKLIDQNLLALVNETLSEPEIVDGLQRTKLDQAEIRRQVFAARDEVLAPAEADLERLLDETLGEPAETTRWSSDVLGDLFDASAFMRSRAQHPAAALERWRQTCRNDGVLPFVRRLINNRLAPQLRVSLTVTEKDAPGLRGADDRAFIAATASVGRFLDAARRLPVGAIGISGPRGVGKTTLIEFYSGGSGALKVMVSAPVQYEPREFVLHLFATVCRAIVREHSVRRLAARRLLRRPKPTINELLVELAREHLDTITFLQSHTTGWSGKVALPLRSEAGWSRQTQRERRTQTYPEIVTSLRDLLAQYSSLMGDPRPAVVIAIDELDKIDSAEQAQRFLNEIKGVFGAEGTQFLVSVSEEALAAFERRGLPVRDAFDSAFHEIVRVDYLTLLDTAEVLSSRVIGLPEPFVWLVHCLSGGLPRDVIRTARAMLAGNETSPTLDQVCARLVAEDLERKAHAFQLACRDFGDAPEVTTFIRALRSLASRKLLDVLPELRVDGELAVLSRQAATYVYYSATLLEVFTRERVDQHDSAMFDTLARAKQSLAVHPRLAWLLVDEFREAWGLATVSPD